MVHEFEFKASEVNQIKSTDAINFNFNYQLLCNWFAMGLN